jgi:Domain of unknown function (DUF4389)
MSEQLPPVALDAAPAHPIRVVVTDDLRRNRLTVFFRLLLVIPHVIVLALWGIVVYVLAIVAWVIGIFTGRLPDGLHGFFASYLRYTTQVNAYFWLAADPFPSFGGGSGYPVDLEVAPAAKQSRLTIFFRLLLAIPAVIVLYVLQLVGRVVSILGWFYALFTGTLNKGMRDLLVYCIRYEVQTGAYILLLTGRYPSFSDD